MRDGSLVREKLCALKCTWLMVLTPAVNLSLQSFLGGPQRNVEPRQTPDYSPEDGETQAFHENAPLSPAHLGAVGHSESAISAQSPFCLDQTEFTLGNHCTFSSLFLPALELRTAVGFQSQCPTEKSAVLVSGLAVLFVLGID